MQGGSDETCADDLDDRSRPGRLDAGGRHHDPCRAERSERSGGMELPLIESGEFTIGRRRFYAYLYTNDGMVTCTRVALFYTDKNLYECTITHLPYSESELPSRERMQEIHQIVLGGITW